MDISGMFPDIKKIVLNLKFQFFITLLLFIKYLFRLIFSNQTDILIAYIIKITPNFIKTILNVSIMELKVTLLFSQFMLFLFFILIIILSTVYEQNKIRKNYYSTRVTIDTLDKIFITITNIIVCIWLIKLINGMSLRFLFELSIKSNKFFSIFSIAMILFVYFLGGHAFFLKEEKNY